MSNIVRSNSNQIELHQDNENAELELQAQEVTSPSVPPGFKAAAAAAAVAAATAAAMTSANSYVANLNRGNTQSSTTTAAREFRPTATLHYTPPHQQGGQLPRSQIGVLQQQPQHGLLPRQPPTGQPPPPNAAPTQQPPPPNATPTNNPQCRATEKAA